ncbi:MAG: YIP1 family protein [Acidobacteriota bacterium]
MSETDLQPDAAAPASGAPRPQDVPVVQEPARLGPLQRLVGVLFSPGETFEDVNRRPTWLAPLLIVTLIGFAASVFFEWRAKPNWESFFRTQITKSVEKSGGSMTPEQIDQQVAMQTKFAKTDLTSPLSVALSVVKILVYTLFTCLIPAGIYALGLMLMQAQTTFKKILSVVAWSTAGTGLVGALVFVGALMVRDQESFRDIKPTEIASLVPTNLGIVLPQDMSPFLSSLIGSIDIFTIWLIVLLVIGFVAISGKRRMTNGRAATLIISLWVVWALIKAGLAGVFRT